MAYEAEKSHAPLGSGVVKHGHNRVGKVTPEYRAWGHMVGRCTTESDAAFKNYGGRGIKVCDRWLDFVNFLADMGERPPGKTIDRIDNNGDYCKENCKWSTPQEQSRNRRSNHLLTFQGKTMNITEWSEEIGINHRTIRSRINYGFSIERVLSTSKE